MDCFGTYFTHVQTCNVTRVQTARYFRDLWMLRNVEKKMWIGECIRCIQKNSFSENIGLKKHKKPNKPLLEEAPPRSLWNNFLQHKPM